LSIVIRVKFITEEIVYPTGRWLFREDY